MPSIISHDARLCCLSPSPAEKRRQKSLLRTILSMTGSRFMGDMRRQTLSAFLGEADAARLSMHQSGRCNPKDMYPEKALLLV
jgi:hypothetical protein